jgi:hypothetical protein
MPLGSAGFLASFLELASPKGGRLALRLPARLGQFLAEATAFLFQEGQAPFETPIIGFELCDALLEARDLPIAQPAAATIPSRRKHRKPRQSVP